MINLNLVYYLKMYQLGLVITNKNLVSLHFIDLKMDRILSLLSLNYNTDAYKNRSSSVSISTYVKTKDY